MENTYKQLKDARFPFIRAIGNISNGVIEIDGIKYLKPKLDELIESCADGFHSLIKSKTFQFFDGHRDIAWSCNGSIVGSETPEEAVAKLYLALNSK